MQNHTLLPNRFCFRFIIHSRLPPLTWRTIYGRVKAPFPFHSFFGFDQTNANKQPFAKSHDWCGLQNPSIHIPLESHATQESRAEIHLGSIIFGTVNGRRICLSCYAPTSFRTFSARCSIGCTFQRSLGLSVVASLSSSCWMDCVGRLGPSTVS